MQICTSSMSAMLAITKHRVCVLIVPCLVIFIMADMEEIHICFIAIIQIYRSSSALFLN